MRAYLAAIILLAISVSAHPQQSQQCSPLGRLIDVGGRKLHLYCTGQGSPTVILMAGGGAFSIDWALVQPKVARDTRVCSYDRAGLAWSDPASKRGCPQDRCSNKRGSQTPSAQDSPPLVKPHRLYVHPTLGRQFPNLQIQILNPTPTHRVKQTAILCVPLW
jgi:pimeloyl-ACP methyl ester carboxylesterase